MEKKKVKKARTAELTARQYHALQQIVAIRKHHRAYTFAPMSVSPNTVAALVKAALLEKATDGAVRITAAGAAAMSAYEKTEAVKKTKKPRRCKKTEKPRRCKPQPAMRDTGVQIEPSYEDTVGGCAVESGANGTFVEISKTE